MPRGCQPNIASSSIARQQLQQFQSPTSTTTVAQVRETPEVSHADSKAQSGHGEIQTTAPCSPLFRRLFRRRRHRRKNNTVRYTLPSLPV